MQLPAPREHADRHLRRADDGEPVVRPLPRLDAERGRAPGRRAATSTRRASRRRPTASRPSTRAAATRTPATAGSRAGSSSTTASSTAGSKEGSDTDEFALGYYEKGDLGFIQDADRRARRPSTASSARSSASTYPNREYMWAAQSYGRSGQQPCRSTRRRLPVRDHALRGGRARGRHRPATTSTTCRRPRCGAGGLRAREPRRGVLRARAQTGTLPNVSFVDPPFKDGGGGDGISADEHPHGDVRLGQAYMSDVVHAFMESPQWERGAIFVVYDEWGGFFDHVRPPRVPDIRNSRNLDEDFGQMGFRIPALAAVALRAPRARRPRHLRLRVDHQADPLPLRREGADAARRVRAQHRLRVRLAAASRGSSRRSCPTPRTSSPRPAPHAGSASRSRSRCPTRCRRSRAGGRARGRSRTTSPCSSRPATWTGWGSPTTPPTRGRCSASRRR